MNAAPPQSLVFSDLDGSLLDHYSYSFAPALSTLRLLEELNIPLILVSSKTCAEISALRTQLDNCHPFIVENGAAVYIPRGYFPQQPAGTQVHGDYWVHEMAPSRDFWLAELAALAQEFDGAFDTFYTAGVAGIMAMTGLSETQAIAANNRGYSEPVKWLGSAQLENRFIARLRDAGATVARGGRFLCVTGPCDKGQALTWLRDEYGKLAPSTPLQDIAIGDSDNDRAMLEAAQHALLIRSPTHDFPTLTRTDNVIRSDRTGPAGWAEGVAQWLQEQGFTA